MLEIPSFPVKVSRKDRLTRARSGIDLHAWLKGAVVSVLTAVLTINKNWWAIVAGIGAGGLVMLVQLVDNYLHAEVEILRERLDGANKRLADLERHSSEKVAILLAGLAWAQNLAAREMTTEAEVEQWLREIRVWLNFLQTFVEPKVEEHEWLRLRHADDDGQPYRGAVNEHHRKESRKLRARMSAIQLLIDENRA